MIMTSRVFENLPFHSPHKNDDRSTFSEVSTFKRFFENLRFRGPPFLKLLFSIVLVWTVIYKRRFSKTEVFENVLALGPLVKVLEVVNSPDRILTTHLTNGKRPVTMKFRNGESQCQLTLSRENNNNKLKTLFFFII